MWLLRRAGVLESGVIKAMSAEEGHCLWTKSKGRPSKTFRERLSELLRGRMKSLTSNYITISVSCISFLATCFHLYFIVHNIYTHVHVGSHPPSHGNPVSLSKSYRTVEINWKVFCFSSKFFSIGSISLRGGSSLVSNLTAEVSGPGPQLD